MARIKIKNKKRSKAQFAPSTGLHERVRIAQEMVKLNTLPEFKAGDSVRVHVKIQEGDKERVQAFEGTVIGLKNKGINSSFTVRKIAHGVGVERVFLKNSPRVAKVDVLAIGRVRRAKLTYLRGLEGRAARVERATAKSSTQA